MFYSRWLSFKKKTRKIFPTPRTLNPQLQPAWFTIVFTMWVGWKCCIRCYRHHDVEASSSRTPTNMLIHRQNIGCQLGDHGFLWGTSTKLSWLLVPTRFEKYSHSHFGWPTQVTFKGNFVAYSMCFWKHLLNHLKARHPQYLRLYLIIFLITQGVYNIINYSN